MPDASLIERVAGALGADESLIEKDWYLVRALGVIASVQSDDMTPVFSGGTSLSKGWGLIKRFSEDVDFKVISPANLSSSMSRKLRSAYRTVVLKALEDAGFTLDGDPLVGNDSRYFSATFEYDANFPIDPALRRRLKIEMSFAGPLLAPVGRPLQSFLGLAQRLPPEIEGFPCVDPVETAGDKLSALSWRAHRRDRADPRDDPTIVRHLHDLAALETLAMSNAKFAPLVMNIINDDLGRVKDSTIDAATLLRNMPDRLSSDAQWRKEYADLVDAVSFASEAEQIDFDAALSAGRRLVDEVLAD